MLLLYFGTQSAWALGLLGLILLLALIIAIQAHRNRVRGGNEELPGMLGEVTEASDSRGRAWAMVRGEAWQVRSGAALTKGQMIRVKEAHGLWLVVEPLADSATEFTKPL